MKDKNAIWLFAGGEMQAIASKKILNHGYKLIITDQNPDCYCAKFADELVEKDTFDIKGNLEVSDILKSKFNIRGVVTIAADCHETVAWVANNLGLHGISPKISNICRYKNKTREVLSRAGIPQPNFKIVENIDEARSFAKSVNASAVLKATNNSGSRGFSFIQSLDDINTDTFEKARSFGTSGKVLIEECLAPLQNEISEQSVETLWIDGNMYWLNWVDRLFRKDFKFFNLLTTGIYENVVWAVELGHINPAIHNPSTRKYVYDLIYNAGLAIGMKKQKGANILKADIMLTKKGPIIIELTPRLSGGWDSSKSTPARGGDFVGAAIELSTGKRVDIDFWDNYFNFKNPNLFSSVLASVNKDATDCIGRKFALGTDFEREKSLKIALKNLKGENYVLPVE